MVNDLLRQREPAHRARMHDATAAAFARLQRLPERVKRAPNRSNFRKFRADLESNMAGNSNEVFKRICYTGCGEQER